MDSSSYFYFEVTMSIELTGILIKIVFKAFNNKFLPRNSYFIKEFSLHKPLIN